MPRFGGFAPSTGGFVGSLVNNAVGSVANSLFPTSGFGGFGGALNSNLGQSIKPDVTHRQVKLRVKSAAAAKRILGDPKGLMGPIYDTAGMIFPYTPAITYNQTADYQAIQTTHANQDFHVFARRPATELTVDGAFTVQNQTEGVYAMACIHFLRSVTMMNFGQTDPNAGTPPPVLIFDAYGPFVFFNLPVIVKSFNVTFPEDVDYVQVNTNGVTNTTTPGSPGTTVDNRIVGENLSPIGKTGQQGGYNIVAPFGSGGYIPGARTSATTSVGGIQTSPGTPGTTTKNTQPYQVWLPSMFKITANLIVQHTPATLRTKFNLPAFVNGSSDQASFI